MGVSPFRLDQPPGLEIPQAAPVDVQPAMPPQQRFGIGAGWMGAGGKAAAIGASILEGWMAGERVKEQRLQQQAQNKLVGARYGYAQSIQALSDWRLGNPDPEKYVDPKSGRKGREAWQQMYNTLVADARNSRDLYADTMQSMVIKEPQPRGKGAGGALKAVGRRMERGLTAQQPQMFAQKMIDVFRSQDVERTAIPDPTRAAQLRREETTTQAEQLRVQTERQVLDANKAAVDAMNSGDYPRMATAMNTVNALSGRADKIITPDMLQSQADDWKVKSQQSAMLSSIYNKVQTAKPLDESEQAIWNASWGIPPERQVWQAYIDMVGKPGSFPNRLAAARSFLQDQAMYRNTYRPETLTDMREQAAIAILRAQHPEDPNYQPSRQEINEFLGKFLFRQPGGGRIPVAQARQAVSRALESVVGKNPDYKGFVNTLGTAAGGITYSIKPDYGPSGWSWLPWKESRADVEAKHGKFMSDVSSYLAGQGYTEEDIRQMIGAARFGMEEQPPIVVTPQRNLTPPAKGLRPPPTAGVKKYRISYSGASTEGEFTPEDVQYFRDQGATVEEVGGGRR